MSAGKGTRVKLMKEQGDEWGEQNKLSINKCF